MQYKTCFFSEDKKSLEIVLTFLIFLLKTLHCGYTLEPPGCHGPKEYITVEPLSFTLMLHAKFQNHRPCRTGAEDF